MPIYLFYRQSAYNLTSAQCIVLDRLDHVRADFKMMPIGSLTGGGGLSASSSASSAIGDQKNGGFTIGDFSPNMGGVTNQQMLIGGAFVVGAVALYAISRKKR